MPKQKQVSTFHIASLDAAETFYNGILNFKKDWQWQHDENLPFFASFSRGEHSLYLTEHKECGPCGLVHLFFETRSELIEYCKTINQNGGTFEYGPIDQAWGLTEAQICDPDGNKLRLCAETKTQ